ncbi:hypothetical protein [Streptomyces europaeiscabiei]|uniref:hypothetical protein n=1 Tax=Streptomyces europaeiscabiei TaxID=146819 RepID=UPI0029B143C4|nr:hypothetical protein [Streptomyces europaeiscabiei]MDX3583830.1 hypothetical protein [Streptomyces europaeiscabiei]WUD32894.1 hypothetical protein OG858_16655 [Streptomyces europaeiscabiei]
MPAAAGTEAAWRARLDTPVRWVGAATGLAVNALVSFDPEPDVDLLYGFPVFALCVMAGVFAADLTARPGSGWIRVAQVAPRRIREYLPRSLSAVLAVQAGLLLMLVTIAAVTASADADGRSGRALSVTCPAGTQLLSPWPGPYYAWPALSGLAAGTVACALLLHRVTVRSGSVDQRRISVRAAVGAWGVLVTAPLFAVSSTMAEAVLNTSCASLMQNVALWGLGLAALTSAVTAGHCLSVLLLPQIYIKARP